MIATSYPASVERATWEAMLAATRIKGVRRLTAGNYGGKLGPFHFHLRALAPAEGAVP